MGDPHSSKHDERVDDLLDETLKLTRQAEKLLRRSTETLKRATAKLDERWPPSAKHRIA